MHLGLNFWWPEERSLREAGATWRIVRQVLRLKPAYTYGPVWGRCVRRRTDYAAKAKQLRRFETAVPIDPLNFAQDFIEHLANNLELLAELAEGIGNPVRVVAVRLGFFHGSFSPLFWPAMRRSTFARYASTSVWVYASG